MYLWFVYRQYQYVWLHSVKGEGKIIGEEGIGKYYEGGDRDWSEVHARNWPRSTEENYERFKSGRPMLNTKFYRAPPGNVGIVKNIR